MLTLPALYALRVLIDALTPPALCAVLSLHTSLYLCALLNLPALLTSLSVLPGFASSIRLMRLAPHAQVIGYSA